MFIIARPKGVVGGPPLAVKRVEDPVLPIGFQMSQKHVMIPTNKFAGEIDLSAKWAKSGSPMQSTAGDLETSKVLSVNVGDKNLQLVLDRVVE